MLLYEREVRTALQAALGRVLSGEHIQVLEQKAKGVLWLTASGNTEAQFEGDTLPWTMRQLQIQSQDRTFWFGLRVRFEGGHDLEFRSASIIIAMTHGRGRLIPVVRAECDVTESIHAQPHWHVFMTQEDNYSDGSEDVASVAEFLGKYSGIHWAMCAGWAVDKGHHTSFSESSHLAKWCEGCLAYVKGQLSYIEGKLSSV